MSNQSFTPKRTAHRQWIMAVAALSIVAALIAFTFFTGKQTEAPETTRNNINAFEQLMAGNARFAAGAPRHPDESILHRKAVAKGQHPIAVVVACSDSRLSPELIFDQGLGDLFVIRTAGNLVSALEMGSIEYAVEHLGVSTIIVLGHEHCGAVEALMGHQAAHGHIKTIIDSLKQELEIKDALAHHDVHAAVIANVHHQVLSIANDPLIAELASKHPITVKGAIYTMDSGIVHPLETQAVVAHKATL